MRTPLRLVCSLKPATDFTLPKDPSHPVIMIGPGTGVAPFMGFVQQRSADTRSGDCASYGPMLLYFGCRHEAQDWIYQDEMKAAEAAGTLSRLRTAFSRDSPDGKKCYVQHRLIEDAAELSHLILERNARVFVCGDGMHMAKDVHRALVGVVMTEPKACFSEVQGNMPSSNAEHIQQQCGAYCGNVESSKSDATGVATRCETEVLAEVYISHLKSTGRYVEDIWG